ncbi:metallophosphoesterase [Aliidiomarina indica]|uniref:metallophosphoesterase n=1 Tax=Aliidiomarina indica TaxID=2749147 RepID=UPI00188E23C5|nr:metallophosphoesterase [Aliidiomarina indica]
MTDTNQGKRLPTGYDIIGDIHGHADKLIALLDALGYASEQGVYRHPERKAVFVGDLIDNGRSNREVMTLVKAMHEAGNAHVVMGNHEFNAVGWAIPKPDGDGFLREHTAQNRAHHIEFLEEIPDPQERQNWLDWFKTLPLFLDLGPFRVVHACWHEPSMDVLSPYLHADHSLREDAWVPAFTESHPLFKATETVLKGVEVDLPENTSFFDHKGKERFQVRISWWESAPESLAAIAHIPNPSKNQKALAALAKLSADPRVLREFSYQGNKPVFFGHYWLTGTPQAQSKYCACVDYSAGRDGPLTAYRWQGESELNDDHFLAVYP